MTMVCFVVFSENIDFDQDRWMSQLVDPLPGGVRVSQVTKNSEDISQIDFENSGKDKLDPGTVFVSKMPPLQIDAEDLGSPLWPLAQQELASNQCHWIVTTACSELSPVNEALLLTHVTDAILRSHSAAVGVLWHKHGLKLSSRCFREIVASLAPQELPTSLWIDINVIADPSDPDTPPIALTSGMDAFDLMEIECIGSPEPPDEIRDRIDGICDYLLKNGPVLEHGNTLGESETERILVLHTKSAFGREGKVIQLRYEGGDDHGKSTLPQPDPPVLKSIVALMAVLLVTGFLVFGLVKLVGFIVHAVQATPDKPVAIVASTEEGEKAPAPPAQQQSTIFRPSAKTPNEKVTPAFDTGRLPISQSLATDQEPETLSESVSNTENSNRISTDTRDTRPWNTGSDGIVIDAKIVGVDRENGETKIRLQRADGERVTIPYASISEEDQDYAKDWYRRQNEERHSTGAAGLPVIGDTVRIEWGNKWWDGEVIEVDAERFKVTYAGWGSNWDEWKTSDQLRWSDDTPVIPDEPVKEE
ncbi:hypothetical protein CA13_29910 [Planctomycetes bacterium CA13]|uniref:DUF4261 domain-containing protein n=1 Tax=Novipirellula herctigrandis TaxID=2527986 RepID=A0A5C5Z2I5_9BACT|nr:hypothetical protein CA13_29910 [Planctomycetes bacterium CA13]